MSFESFGLEVRSMIEKANDVLYPDGKLDWHRFLGAHYCAYPYLRSWWSGIEENRMPEVDGYFYDTVRDVILGDILEEEGQAMLVLGLTIARPETEADHASLAMLWNLKVVGNMVWRAREAGEAGLTLDEAVERVRDSLDDTTSWDVHLTDIQATLWSLPEDDELRQFAWEVVRRQRLATRLLPLLRPMTRGEFYENRDELG